MKRACTTCLAREIKRPAEDVCADATGLMWFECREHSETDNVGGLKRTNREPIEEFFEAIGIPLDEVDDIVFPEEFEP